MYFPTHTPLFRSLLSAIAGRPIAIVGHARPDGDCIGAQIALARVLRALGHETLCVNADPVPRRLRYLLTPETPFHRPDDIPSGTGSSGTGCQPVGSEVARAASPCSETNHRQAAPATQSRSGLWPLSEKRRDAASTFHEQAARATHPTHPAPSSPARQRPIQNPKSKIQNFHAIFVDCSDHDRAGAKARHRFPAPVGSIDHHLSNIAFAAHNIVAPAAAATCEILAGIFLDLALPIDPATAKALYAGINTDTGQFRFASTTPLTFALASELVSRGADPAEAGYEIYERESWGKLQLLQTFLRTLTLECDNRACIGILPNGIFEKTNTTAEDTEGLVDYARCIDGVEIGVLIEERPDRTIKASLRAKNPAMRVDLIAAQFGGGGHACAAGLNHKTPIPTEEFRARLLAAITTQLAAGTQKT